MPDADLPASGIRSPILLLRQWLFRAQSSLQEAQQSSRMFRTNERSG